MRKLFLITAIIGVFITKASNAWSQEINAVKSPLEIGEVLTIQSKILMEERVLNVYLPPSYAAQKEKDYPVIYLLDGSMDEDFVHVVGLVQFNAFSWINKVPESIVVGIANVDRKRDFTYPSNNEIDQKELPTSGGSASFIDFIEKEVKPLIHSTYRSNDISTLIGQSLGGLLATEILFKSPQNFNNYIVVSPSLWWDDNSLLEATPIYPKEAKQIYIAVGKEGETMETLARQLHEKLAEINYDNHTLYFQFLAEQDHGDALHLAVYNAFEKIFNKTQ